VDTAKTSDSGPAVVFALVAAAFLTVYVTQPVLPILSGEFAVTAAVASLTVSAVVLGIALANLPFGVLADRFPIRPIVLGGGCVVALASVACAITRRIDLLIAARFVQGLFIPSLTTCIAAYLSRTLPPARLNVVMGWYVSATVTGGMGGRLLGGFIFPGTHWRLAFVAAAAVVAAAVIAASRWLPRDPPQAPPGPKSAGFLALLSRPELLRMFAVGFFAFFVFSAVFNYLPFYLSGAPLHASVRLITLMYLAYLVGIAAGPFSGSLILRWGTGATLIAGSALFALAIALTLIPSLPVIALSLALVCGGFFAMHAGAVGSLNGRLTGSRGRANSLYVLLYYLGGAAGISATGAAYARFGWSGAAALGSLALVVPGLIGVVEMWGERRKIRDALRRPQTPM
jgi:MFS transporter, YNFM family, putative membrane transport protein